MKQKKPKTIHRLDAESQSLGIRDGARARQFCITHAEALIGLIGTYSDAAAEDLLGELRETFWTDTHRWGPQVDTELRAALDAATKGGGTAATPAPGKEP